MNDGFGQFLATGTAVMGGCFMLLAMAAMMRGRSPDTPFNIVWRPSRLTANGRRIRKHYFTYFFLAFCCFAIAILIWEHVP